MSEKKGDFKKLIGKGIRVTDSVSTGRKVKPNAGKMNPLIQPSEKNSVHTKGGLIRVSTPGSVRSAKPGTSVKPNTGKGTGTKTGGK